MNSPLPGEDGVGVPREEVNDYNNYMKEKKLFDELLLQNVKGYDMIEVSEFQS